MLIVPLLFLVHLLLSHLDERLDVYAYCAHANACRYMIIVALYLLVERPHLLCESILGDPLAEHDEFIAAHAVNRFLTEFNLQGIGYETKHLVAREMSP